MTNVSNALSTQNEMPNTSKNLSATLSEGE